MSQKDHRDLDAPTPPGGPLRRDAPSPPEPGHEQEESTDETAQEVDDE